MMNCKHWERHFLFVVFSLAFALSLMMMSYIHLSTKPRAPLQDSPKNENSSITAINVDNKTQEGDPIPLQHSPKNENPSITAINVDNKTYEGDPIPLQHSPKNENSSKTAINVDNKTYEGDPIPLIDFKDLGKRKKRVLLLVTVGSAPQRSDRRQGIRSTWWNHCKHQQVECVFLTDGNIEDPTRRALVLQERNRYRDLEFLPVAGGLVFGQRFLNQIKWAKAKFDFQYLLKIDDDYFLCLKRLLSELPLRPKENLVWGHFHCEAGITWADEAFVIFSRDIIHRFLKQDKNKTLCHPFGDQTFHLWLNNMSKVYFHDSRLHHDPPASFLPNFEKPQNVCDSFIGIHGTYGDKMREFWLNSNDGVKNLDGITLPSFSSFCANTRFDHTVFGPKYNFEPKPCIDNPRWTKSTEMYAYGREKHDG